MNEIGDLNKEQLILIIENLKGAQKEDQNYISDLIVDRAKWTAEVLEREQRLKKIIEWSERITKAATDMLNRGQDREKIELRKCIDEWLDKELYELMP